VELLLFSHFIIISHYFSSVDDREVFSFNVVILKVYTTKLLLSVLRCIFKTPITNTLLLQSGIF